MRVLVQKSKNLGGEIRAPPSKSYTHRAFIISSLASGRSIIKEPLIAEDTLSTLAACKAFGVRVEEGEEIAIHGSGGHLKSPSKEIDVGNSGTTLRLISGMAALDGRVSITGDESIKKRPMQPLLDALCQLGVRAYSKKGDGTPPIVINGKGLVGGEAKIRGDISSQFISSLLISSPYAKKDVTISLTSKLKSRPYIDITLDIMEKFGIEVENIDYLRFNIGAGGCYESRVYPVEGDYSSASYFFSLAALTGSKITVKNLRSDSKQGDKIMLEILEDMGADVVVRKDEVGVMADRLRGIRVSLADTPDLLPPVVLLASKAKGKTVIENVEHARYKETDRIYACTVEFRKFGVAIKERKDGLVIEGSEKLKGAEVHSYADHRMAMALTIAGLCAEGDTIVDDAESVNISFPGFYDELRSLGAGIKEV